jgi:hypothetical protein
MEHMKYATRESAIEPYTLPTDIDAKRNTVALGRNDMRSGLPNDPARIAVRMGKEFVLVRTLTSCWSVQRETKQALMYCGSACCYRQKPY